MPRKTLDEQKYPFFGSRRHDQWPGPTVWGRTKAGLFGHESPSAMRALDRWASKRVCDRAACPGCVRDDRLARIRAMYGRRRR